MMCSAIQMVQHLPPYHDVHPLQARSLIVGGGAPALSRPQDQSEAFLAFLARCLAKAPDERATAAELLAGSAFLRPENQPTGACLAEPLARGASICARSRRRASRSSARRPCPPRPAAAAVRRGRRRRGRRARGWGSG